MSLLRTLILTGLVLVLLPACSKTATDVGIDEMVTKTVSDATSIDNNSAVKGIKFEKYTLPNGLDVVLHVDNSDPVVAIDLTAHVGSSREVPGRTGFAHLFEHLLFLDSENLGYGGLDEMNTRIGGQGTNGYTTNDVTKYFQAVPKDALEKIIWAEADKIGYFINTVTEQVVAKEKQVVKNEKRQRVDNVPYGHRFYIIGKALYDDNHPYNWQVIGSLEDLEAASAKDAQDFYKRWYVPNNVTVTLAGDFEISEAKKLISKYFSEIPRGDEITAIKPMPSTLSETQTLYYEDNFAKVPQLVLTWPTVEQFHPDSYALNILSEYLSTGKRAPLNEVLIDEDKVTSQVGTFPSHSEIAGAFYLFINAQDGADLDALLPSLKKGMQRFEKNGISQADLDLILAGQEVAFYQQLQSALGKAIQLGEYNAYTNDPGFINTDIKNLQAVTREDVMRVYKKYIKDQAHVSLSIVPKGNKELTVENASLAKIVEEKVVQGAEEQIAESEDKRDFPKTKSSFDRTQEPAFGPAYSLAAPKIWESNLRNGIQLLGIENTETPLVYFSLSLDTGLKDAELSKPAVPSLTAQMLEKGTKDKTTAELEDAIKALGSSISVSSGRSQTVISGQSLARNLDKTLALVEEILIEPRWDTEEFSLLKTKTINDLASAEGSPNYYSQREWNKALYPDNHIYQFDTTGPKELVETISLDDLKAFYAKFYSPQNAKFKVVGSISETNVMNNLSSLNKTWTKTKAETQALPALQKTKKAQVLFYDIPGAKQSILRMGSPSISPIDKDYSAADAMNYLLGGIYTSRLNTELRVNKGYTYGIRSGFSGIEDHGLFTVRSSVRTNITLEALELIRDIVGNYGSTFTDEDLKIMQSALIKGQALSTETLGSKLSMLNDIAAYDYPHDYLNQNAETIKAICKSII